MLHGADIAPCPQSWWIQTDPGTRGERRLVVDHHQSVTQLGVAVYMFYETSRITYFFERNIFISKCDVF